jgi:ribosomal protein S18 acetylase RimI-like enzyme
MVTVSRAVAEDAAALASMLGELADFYELAGDGRPAPSEGEVVKALFGPVGGPFALIARVDNADAGFATCSVLWPASGSASSLLFLKELFVRGSFRRRGVGSALMRAVFDTAEQLGCSRVDWTTEKANTAAQAFYSARGHLVEESKIYYRVRRDEDGGFARRPTVAA